MNFLKYSRFCSPLKVQQIAFSWWTIVIVLPFPWWNVPEERSCLLFSNQKKLLWQTWHSIQTFLLLFLLVSSEELRCVCGLTCRGLLAGDVGFDVRRQVRGFRVLAWRQVGRHGRPGCHRRRWIPSHWWGGIPGHPSASAWLRKDEARVFRTSAYRFNHRRPSLWTTLNRVECVSYPAHCGLCEGVISSRPSPWKASLAIERLWLQIEKGGQWSIPFTQGWKSGWRDI